ncbi:MFS transporter [Pontibacter mangrovi]|uniref:MFS transporter n=1 Tax=Pontibacter mangrovi TaxID=2589816 RepID=A0A501W7G6_9BACT|nr:MFS transporter [Pontibacter mangrovi]TPE44642.1 MFS transporter [Pontibacter mangrovi]
MLQKILNALKKEFRKPTPFLLIGILGIGFFTFVFFALLPDQTAGLGVAYAFFLVIALFVAVVADRLAVRMARLRPVIYSEFILLLLLYAVVMYSYRTTKLVVTTDKDHFVVVYKDGGETVEDFEYVFPFSRKLEISNQECIVLAKSLEDRNDIIIMPMINKETDAWRGYSTTSDEVYLNGKWVDVKIFWTGNVDADTDEFLTCAEQL